jgi:hypothetical protein
MACRKDLKAFCLAYFPKVFKLPFSSYHLQVIERLEEMMIKGTGKLSLAMPRGSGKTSLATAAAIWALLYGHRRYVVVVGANREAAEKNHWKHQKTTVEKQRIAGRFPRGGLPVFQTGWLGTASTRTTLSRRIDGGRMEAEIHCFRKYTGFLGKRGDGLLSRHQGSDSRSKCINAGRIDGKTRFRFD